MNDAIWLEVTEVRYETVAGGTCTVLLKGDREHPKPVWWQVEPTAAGNNAFETYKAILNEVDKKRIVLARLSCDKGSHLLRCDAFRFQSPELGNR